LDRRSRSPLLLPTVVADAQADRDRPAVHAAVCGSGFVGSRRPIVCRSEATHPDPAREAARAEAPTTFVLRVAPMALDEERRTPRPTGTGTTPRSALGLAAFPFLPARPRAGRRAPWRHGAGK